MALTSTLGSPGIEIREVDKSYRPDSSTATTIYVPGFAAQGPVDEVMSIGSISDFEVIYGTPTNAAERYFYYTVKSLIDNSGNGVTVLCSRLPYGADAGDTVSNAYTMLAYPAIPVSSHIGDDGSKVYNIETEYSPDDKEDITYVIGAPASFQITLKEYYQIITGETLHWKNKRHTFNGDEANFGSIDSIGNSAFIVINTSRSIINNNFEGFYLGLSDNLFVTPSDDYTFNSIKNVKISTSNGTNTKGITKDDYQVLSPNRLTFKLDDNTSGSISSFMARNITSMDTSSKEYDDTINMALFKLSQTTDSQSVLKLNYSIREKYNCSFGKTRMKSSAQSSTPVSYFVENIVENSPNLTVLMNPYVSEKSFVDTEGNIHGKIRILSPKLTKTFVEKYANDEKVIEQVGFTVEILNTIKNYLDELDYIVPFGTYSSVNDNKNKEIGELPLKLERALQLVENDEQYPDIDIVLESGLGTVFAYSQETDEKTIFDENANLEAIELMRTGKSSIDMKATNFISNYNNIQNVFLKFANSMQNGGRGDCFYISDVPRGILIKGKNTKVTNLYGTSINDSDQEIKHSFPTSIYYPIKHTFDNIVSSYMSTYAQWVKVRDSYSGEKVWIPVSGYIAANMASTDGTYGPWYAAAGLRRGVINGVLDYAISPTVTQRTDLYKICINSVPKIPNYGLTIWGIRTMSKKDSAFDQNTCRRTFLYMEKKVKQMLRYYLFEPNNSYTRLQIFNDIDPFMEKIKNSGGIYSYTLVCDTTNNTPDVINNGDLAVSIAAAPTRTAENIVVEFTANKYTEEVSASESML